VGSDPLSKIRIRKKKFAEKLISRHNMQPSKTLSRREYIGKIYAKNIRKNHVGSEKGSGFGPEKNHPESTTLVIG
jgi:hypothetical protein